MDTSNFGIIDGLVVVIIGFAMVFIILAFISFVLSIFSFISKLNQRKTAEETLQPEPISELIKIDNENKEDDLELVAAITAAIAASMNTVSDRIIIHSIRKTSDWNKAAIHENQRTYY